MRISTWASGGGAASAARTFTRSGYSLTALRLPLQRTRKPVSASRFASAAQHGLAADRGMARTIWFLAHWGSRPSAPGYGAPAAEGQFVGQQGWTFSVRFSCGSLARSSSTGYLPLHTGGQPFRVPSTSGGDTGGASGRDRKPHSGVVGSAAFSAWGFFGPPRHRPLSPERTAQRGSARS